MLTEPQKELCKSKSDFLKHKRKQKEAKETKVPAFGETMLSQDTTEWPFYSLCFLWFFTKSKVGEYRLSCARLRSRPILKFFQILV
jgi:hypothetical protein